MVAFTPIGGGGHLLSHGFFPTATAPRLDAKGYRRICAEIVVAWSVSDVSAER
jgi:hypothetical protein